MHLRVKPIALALLALFVAPLAVRAAVYAVEDRPRSWREADWSSAGILPPTAAERDARVIVFAGRTGGWKGLVAVHTWIVVKPAGAARWTRYDVAGWGRPVRVDAWAADGRWYGNPPRIVADLRGASAAAAIPSIEAAIRAYPYNEYGDYRVWPGPNSNTFTAAVLRAVPALSATLPPDAIGKDWTDGLAGGWTASRTGVEATLHGLLGFRLGWVEGVEVNLFGLVAGLDLRHPAVKLPGFGRLGLDGAAAAAAAK